MRITTPDIRQVAAEIVAREGGFVNDPDDPGGATKFGVTLGTLQRLKRDKTGDGKVDIEDVRKLTRQDAIEIFITHYFETPNLAVLPKALHSTVFDMYVNSGRNAVRILQTLLRQMGHAVTIDGVVGPETEAAARLAEVQAPRHLVDAYGIARRNYYFDLADRRPKLRKFARSRAGGKGGWITRAETFISPRFHMTDAEFDRRVAGWV